MTRNAQPATRSVPAWAWWIALCVPMVCGCGMPEELPTYYGRHQLGELSASVNGTDVLAGMFSEAGHRVYFRTSLVTSQMDSADTIVWIPNDYGAPSEEVVDWFESWLTAAPDRTVIYVGRDYDSQLQYWEAMLPRVSGEQEKEYKWRMENAELLDRRPPKLDVGEEECLWFRYEQPAGESDEGASQRSDEVIQGDAARTDDVVGEDAPARQILDEESSDSDEPKTDPANPIPYEKVDVLVGPWATGIDVAKCDIRLRTRMDPEAGVTRLLGTGGDFLVARHRTPYAENSQLILVANGSFLLNLPLVNHEHRELAAKLIAATGEPGSVVFLESGPGEPPIDPPHTDNSIWTLFGAFPLNVILLQLAVVGVIFCFARWPIFGRPQRPPPEPASDFARHVAAVGQLLSRTKDRRFASERPTNFGESHARPIEAVAVPDFAPPPPEQKGM